MGRPVECIFWAPAKGRVVCWGDHFRGGGREREESEGGLGEGEREEAPGGLVCAVAGRGPPWFQEEEEKPRIPSAFSLSPFSSSTFRSPPPSSLRERRRRRMGEIIGRGSLGLLPALLSLWNSETSQVFSRGKQFEIKPSFPTSRVAFLIVRACVVSGEARNDYSRVSACGSH